MAEGAQIMYYRETGEAWEGAERICAVFMGRKEIGVVEIVLSRQWNICTVASCVGMIPNIFHLHTQLYTLYTLP